MMPMAANTSHHNHGFPFRHCFQAMKMDVACRAPWAGWNEEISDGGEDRDETLKASRGPEALHHPLAFSQRHVRILGAVVQALVRPGFDLRHDLS
jgi:hypothetical protein